VLARRTMALRVFILTATMFGYAVVTAGLENHEDVATAALSTPADPSAAQPEVAPERATKIPRRSGPRSVPKVAAKASVRVDVRDHGAAGDGSADDTAAIQRANDAVAAAGGGEVYFPPGTYVAAVVTQDSYVVFRGAPGALLRHPDGVSAKPIVRSRLRSATGSVDAGSKTVHVDDPRGFIVGGAVAIRGAGGGAESQSSELSAPVTAVADTFTLRDGFGFSDGSTFTPNYLLVDEEIISYASIARGTLFGVTRALFGTEAVAHDLGASVWQSSVLYARVRAIDPGSVELDRPAEVGVERAPVWIGAVDPQIRSLSFDGRRRPGGSRNNPIPIRYELTTRGVIDRCTIRNGDHGAIALDKGARLSSITNNILLDNGTPADRLGAAIWMFRGASANVLRGNTIGGDSVNGMYVDDRTVQSTEWDADAGRNVIENNKIAIERVGSNIAIALLGSSDNRVRWNHTSGTVFGIRVYTGGQSAVPPITGRNLVAHNTLIDHGYGIWVNGTKNRFIANKLDSVEIRFTDSGESNEFG
jgi:hypothetical protein